MKIYPKTTVTAIMYLRYKHKLEIDETGWRIWHKSPLIGPADF